MNELEYAKLIKLMSTEHATASTLARRNGYEQTYYIFHKNRGTQLRGKYRLR